LAPTGEELVERLARGEPDAIAALHAAYAPYLRAVVRRQIGEQLRSKLDTSDVLQSVWVQLLRHIGRDGWKPASESELRALLVTIARRRLANRARHHARSLAAERAAEGGWEAVPDLPRARPSQLVQADELWDRLVAACPAEHRAVLTLRRDGLTMDEIAARTGLHEGSVRRILRRLYCDLAVQDGATPPEAAAGGEPEI
jgi:RNA polymerase sigma-70 factor (ECF subfamily)